MLLPLLLLSASSWAHPTLDRRATVSGTATVYLNDSTGTPQQLASGILYGIPDAADQIPDSFYTEIGFQYCRAGGSRLAGQGWSDSLEAYKASTTRFDSMLSNYRTTRKYGGTFIILTSDLWGMDATQDSSAPYPGDNGDWSSYDAFLAQLASDMRANDMLDGAVFDIWNEPDGTAFWDRPQSQYMDMWGRGFHRWKSEFPESIISGPSLAGEPSASNSWWTNWLALIAANDSAPEQYAWHLEGGGGDMQSSVARYKSLLTDYGLATDHVVNINEYGIWSEQVPSGSAWWIAQLERVDAYGLRGNWLVGDQLHDLMAGLASKPNATNDSYNYTGGGYWTTPAWQVYRYYATNMTGTRRLTAPTADLLGDVFAVVDDESRTARLLVGARVVTGTFSIAVEKLSALGLAPSGTLDIHTWGFPSTDDHYAELDAPVDLGWYGHDYSGDAVTFPIYQEDVYTAYAFEFQF